MRGLAILLVVFYHNFGFTHYFFFGWLGVDLFFVLSGFLITNLLLKTLHSPNFLQRFYVRRALRIFPVYYLALFIFLIVFPSINLNLSNLSYFLNNQLWLWTFLQNWLYIFKPPENSLFLTHLWSLAVEEQFYLIWPFVILIVKKPKALFFFMLALLMMIIGLRYFLWIYNLENLSYFNLYTFSRIDGICIGSMLALFRMFTNKSLKKITPVIVLILAGFNFLFYFFNEKTQFTLPFLAIIGYTTFAVLFALLVNEGVEQSNKIIIGVFENKILRFFGKISYGLYVFHWPIHLIFMPVFLKWLTNTWDKQNFLLVASASSTTLMGILISIVSFYFYERFFMTFKKS
jgi:peptidoglycan/LPS O-acetylase OafA/YrhL